MIRKTIALMVVVALIACSSSAMGTPSYDHNGISYTAKVTDTPVSPDGTVILLDLPKEHHTKNVGGSDGAGLCVFTSIMHAAMWQNVAVLWDFQKFMTKRPGGGYPDKVKKMIAEICKEKGEKEPAYIQIENGDLEILKLACKTGRMPSVTYSYSPTGRYGGSKIAHMVTLLHADDKWFCVLDNNYPKTYEWMSPEEFKRAYTGGGSAGWTHLLLAAGPPPCPKN